LSLINYKTKKLRVLPYILLLPALIFILSFYVAPLIYHLILSFTDRTLIKKEINPVYLKNYLLLLKDRFFWKSLFNTFLFITISGTFQLALAVLTAFFIRGKTARIISVIILVPWAISEISVSIVWRLLLTDGTGGLNSLLSIFKIKPQLWLVKPALAFLSISLAQAWRLFPLIYLILKTGIYTIPKDIIDISRIECLNRRSIIFKVYVPIMRKIFLLSVLIILIRNFRAFTLIFSLTGGGPLRATELITMFIYREAFIYHNIARASAASVVILLIYSIAVYLYLKIKKGRAFA
jgi:multiple sugar transport system permease protein